MLNLFTAILILISLMGCMANILDDPRVGESYSIYRISCDKPHKMVRDCSNTWGPTRKVVLETDAIDLAANEAGDTLLFTLTLGGQTDESIQEAFLLGATDQVGGRLQRAFVQIENLLNTQGVEILNISAVIAPDWVIHVGKLGNTYGYFLVLDGDGYSVLEKFSVEPSSYEKIDEEIQNRKIPDGE